MNQVVKIPQSLLVKFDQKRNSYQVSGGSFKFQLDVCGDESGDFLENAFGSEDGFFDVRVSIPLNGKRRLSCDVVETLVMRELHKAFQ